MSDNHLQGEVSVSAELTPTGVKAGAKSRFISAIDLFFGNAIDLLNPKLEGIRLRERARNAQDVKLIEALGDKRVQMLDHDPTYAEQVLEQQLRTTARRIENKAQTVRLAIEDLRTSPPTDEQSEAGPEELDPDFLNRFERYAEDATSDQLREKWARVLASEIRTPGTFSAKVMRIVDELDTATAALFERICEHRLENTIVGCLAGELPFMEKNRLVTAGLLVDPGLSAQIRRTVEGTMKDGSAMNFVGVGVGALGFSPDQDLSFLPATGITNPLVLDHGKPAMPVYVLTDEGHAISSILAGGEAGTFQRYLDAVLAKHPTLPLREFRPISPGNLALTRQWNVTTP